MAGAMEAQWSQGQGATLVALNPVGRFSDVAVGPAISSFLETSRILEKESASESQEAGSPFDIELAPAAKLHEGDRPMSPDQPKTADTRRSPNQPAPSNTEPHESRVAVSSSQKREIAEHRSSFMPKEK
jgi:hypothetical protein